MAFVPEPEPSDAPRPAAGSPAAGSGQATGPTAGTPAARRKALNATMAFGDPNAELQRAAKKMIEEAEQKVAAQKEAKASGQASGATSASKTGGLAQTMAFEAIEPDEAERPAGEGRHRTAAFGAVPPSEATGGAVGQSRAASRRRTGLSATIAFGESPAEIDEVVEQARARAEGGTQTKAFEAVAEPSRKTPVPPAPGQRTTPVPPGPGEQPHGAQPSAPAAA
ncbi:MAG: hypothetical protein RIF41_38395, partial [Polyangiaceae bacterium]